MRYALSLLLAIAVFVNGYIYGRLSLQQEWEADLLIHRKNLGTLEHELAKMDDYNLCLKLGGLPTQCAQLMPYLAPSTRDQ